MCWSKTIFNFDGVIWCLVGGLEHVLFLHILGIIIPTDFHIFQRGRAQPPTRCDYISTYFSKSYGRNDHIHCTRCFFWVELPGYRSSGHRSAQVADGESAQEHDLEPKGFVGGMGMGSVFGCGNPMRFRMVRFQRNDGKHIEKSWDSHKSTGKNTVGTSKLQGFCLAGGGNFNINPLWSASGCLQIWYEPWMNHGCQLLAILSIIFWVWVKT